MKSLFLALSLVSAACHALAWQQRVAYDIEARLDTAKHELTAVQRLRYWNNSPDTLAFVWFHLYPNAYAGLHTDLAREADGFHDYRGHFLREGDRGFIVLPSLSADGQPLRLEYNRDRTAARAVLPRLLAPGDSVDFDFSFTVKVPKLLARMGRIGRHYEISQWYPKIVVYDVKGWHPDGYHYLGEFYGDYGSFNVGIWTPKGMKVGATGAEIVDTTNSEPSSNDSLDYHLFCADQVHDFAWCADAAYLDSTEVHGGVAVRVLTLPGHREQWRNVMQYAKDALDFYGRWYGPYPYSTLTVCDGFLSAGGGVEYPNMAIISTSQDKQVRALETAVVHEIGHQWFYGMLGNDEMAEAWLDEGLTTFAEQRYFEAKYGPRGNFLVRPRASRMFPELTGRYIGRMMYHMFAANRMEQPVATRTCLVREPALYAVAFYYKPAQLLWWLKGQLGDDGFDRLMRAYVSRHQFQHVRAADFLALADSFAGDGVSEKLEPWLATTGRCDNGVAGVYPVDPHGGLYAVNVVRRDSLSLPSKLAVTDRKGNVQTIPWNGLDRSMWFMVRAESGVKSAVLDPDHAVPDVNRFNNCWPRKISFTLLPRLPSFGKYQAFFIPLPWYDAVNGFRIEAYIRGGYLLDGGPMLGRHQWTFFPYYGFKSREVNFSFDYQTPMTALPMPPRAYFSVGRGSDTRSASIGLKRSWGRALMAPTESFDLHLEYRRVVDTSRFWDYRDIEPGTCLSAAVSRGSARSGYRFGAKTDLAAGGGFLPNSDSTVNNFSRFSLDERTYLRIWRRQVLKLRGFFGYIAGAAPAQEQFFLSGSNKKTGINNFIVGGQGTLSGQENYHIEGAADVTGYLGRHLRGRAVASANLALPLYKYPIALFADAALLADEFQQLAIKGAYCDAGVLFQLGPVRTLFPLWINRPLENEKRFGFRWKAGVMESFSVGM